MAKQSQLRKEKRANEREKQNTLVLQGIQPKTETQRKAFKGFSQGKNLLLHGLPGTGKTFIALYLALSELQFGEYKQVIIIRSTVATRDMGFLPGSAADKAKVYESPYMNIASELFKRGDAYEILKGKNQLKFSTTAFIRGITLDDTIIIVDEAQNMSSMELHSVFTRVGENSRLIICGDCGQDDLTNPRFKEESGLREAMNILKRMDHVDFIEFNVHDIVRSGFVKEYIIKKDEYEKSKKVQSYREVPVSTY